MMGRFNNANNEQVFVFLIAHAEHNLIKLKLLNYIIIDQRKLLTTFQSVLCEIQVNQTNSSPLNISQSINVE